MAGFARRAALAAAVALVIAPAAPAGGPGMTVGADEDAAKWTADPKAKMDLAALAGFRAVRMTAQWSIGQTAPSSGELTNLKNASAAARMDGIEPIVAIYNVGSSSTPATLDTRSQFVQYAVALARALPAVTTFIVGNEPNSNRYWMPQFNADGTDAAAPAYAALLAAAYDAIKAARPDAQVVGGTLAPSGGDNPASTKPTHSPTTFIKDLGAAYRASGRTTPLMDVFDMHVYEDHSALSPSYDHPNVATISVPDYGKLVSLLTQAFDGTAQKGSTLPILYGEFGVQSIIPAAKAAVYTGTETTGTNPVPEATQASFYEMAFKIAYCQPNVIGILLFHVTDESDLAAWQSGPYYADDTAKSSLAGIRDAANRVRAGTITTCPDATPPAVTLTAPASGALLHGTVTLSATASDNVGINRVEFLVDGAVVASDAQPPYSVSWRSGASGTHTITARALDAVRNAALSSVTVTVDNTPPETTITSTPPSSTSETSATFGFTASEANVTTGCSLDFAPFSACSSPWSYYGLAPGPHTFRVRSADALGNVDPTPASYTWIAGNLLPNGSFETDTSGWYANYATLSQAADGTLGSKALKASLSGTWATFDVYPLPRPVQSAVGGATYTAGGWVRSDTPGRQVCVVLEEAPAGTSSFTDVSQCVTTTTGWQRFPNASKVATAGDNVTVDVVENGAVAGDGFEVDGLFLTTP